MKYENKLNLQIIQKKKNNCETITSLRGGGC